MEVAMNDIPSVMTEMPRRRLATLRSIVATWEERKRFRCELEQKLKDDPHLICDIGLTKLEAEAEIAKPFWQV
jgi:uncharacterized protein YjiS (DUF1127 family)